MTDTKRKRLYWLFKILSILTAVGLPLYAIFDHFPVWKEQGAGRTSVTAVILIGITLIVVFRRSVFEFIRDKFNLKYAPPITIWAVFLLGSYIMEYIASVLSDMNIVFWFGLAGAALGMFFTYLSERYNVDKA